MNFNTKISLLIATSLVELNRITWSDRGFIQSKQCRLGFTPTVNDGMIFQAKFEIYGSKMPKAI